ncbi:MAG: PspC domain-containing protein [Bacteroidota bacterium]|nr:PspC domain-containing protein [Bacteroidota bacterium]
MDKVTSYFEKQAFGVCAWWGEKLGIKTSSIRLFFIYLSFFTVGSPIIIYLAMAFILENKSYFKLKFRRNRTSIWDL